MKVIKIYDYGNMSLKDLLGEYEKCINCPHGKVTFTESGKSIRIECKLLASEIERKCQLQ